MYIYTHPHTHAQTYKYVHTGIQTNIGSPLYALWASPCLTLHTHTHTPIPIPPHTHTYIYIYICVCVCVFIYLFKLYDNNFTLIIDIYFYEKFSTLTQNN